MDRGDGARKGFADTYIPSQVEVMWERYQTSISLASVVSDGIYAYLTPQAGNVTAISVDGNRTLWEYGAGTVVATPLIVENFLVVGTAEGSLYFFERYTGYLHREVFIGHECIQHPLYWNNTIFIPGENWLTAVDPDGTILWSRHFEKEISAPPVGYLNNLYLLTGNQVWCLYKNSTLWKREFNVNFTSGIAASGNLVVTAESGQILALNAISGETKWERDMGCEAFSPAYCNGLLFTATRNGTLYALSTADGSELWNFSTEGVCFQSPVVNRYNILFASGCTLYCLKQNTGEILWTLDFETNLLTGISLVSSIIFTGDSGGVVYCISAPKPDLKVSVYPASPALYERTQVKISFSVFAGIMPAVNATVNLSIPAGTLSNYSGFTDADGIFAVVYTAPAVKDRENFTLKATFSYPGYRNTTRNLTVAVLPMPSVELNLSTEEETVYSGTAVEFTLTVLRDGKPVIGAPVYVWHGDMCIAEGYTDENGSFEFTHKMPEVQRETQIKIEARVYGTAGAPFLEKNASLRVVVVPLPQEGNKEPQVYGSLAVAAVLLLFFSGWNLWEWRKR
ncbi:MAG: PQQ-binding-like beta-propeller repeat protein [Thermoplasmata archaeon]|nr:PQQ-binding-like beta-propeller repeat protein [Thermoplasmata archaeon]